VSRASFKIVVIAGASMFTHSSRSEVGIGSRSHCLSGDFRIIFIISSHFISNIVLDLNRDPYSAKAHNGAMNFSLVSCLCLHNLRLFVETIPTHIISHVNRCLKITCAIRTRYFICFFRKGEFACQLQDEFSSFRFGLVDFFEQYRRVDGRQI